ncbi:MAG: oligoendopeptidase F, partial [Syntrophobacteraceae bacterium]
MRKQLESVLWNLDDLYAGPDDPQIKADETWCREQASALSRYRGKLAELSASEFSEAVRSLEALNERARKLIAHAYLFFSTRTHDSAASALFQSQKEFMSELYRDTLFFELEWTKLEEGRVKSLLSDPDLSGYRHFLESLRRYAPYLLSEPEERILAEKEPAGASAWNALFDKILSQHKFGDRQRTESEVLTDLYHHEREIRRSAAEELTRGLESLLPSLTHIFNTILL